ncbi:MAG: DUF4410 domain-containing protein [Kiloniellales bacterium]|nr:DUF4410 domain-containing protein [Kiloniellales bacterium]
MRLPGSAFCGLLLLVFGSGCASTDVTARRSNVGDEEIPKPTRIIVYSFAATPDDLPADSAIAEHYARRDEPQSEEQKELGRQLGDQVATNLVEDILEMGLPAELAGSGPPPRNGDIVLRGAFITIDEGSRVKRMLIGFGAGAAELRTLVEGYQVTPEGLRPLGSAEVEAAGGYLPGVIVPVGVGAATGRAAASAVVAGGAQVIKEVGPESISAAASRTAEEISGVLREGFKKRGWIEG